MIPQKAANFPTEHFNDNAARSTGGSSSSFGVIIFKLFIYIHFFHQIICRSPRIFYYQDILKKRNEVISQGGFSLPSHHFFAHHSLLHHFKFRHLFNRFSSPPLPFRKPPIYLLYILHSVDTASKFGHRTSSKLVVSRHQNRTRLVGRFSSDSLHVTSSTITPFSWWKDVRGAFGSGGRTGLAAGPPARRGMNYFRTIMHATVIL